MYAWIWRKLPFGLPGKIIGSLLLVSGALSLLWFWLFPLTAGWVEDVLLPFDESTLDPGPGGGTEQPGVNDPGQPGVGTPSPGEETPANEHDIPYDTDE